MKRHLILLTLLVLLSISSPTFGFFFNFEAILQSLVKLRDGGVKFAKDFVAYEKKELQDTTPSNHQEYDYIVVGAGTAGAVTAARLSEIEKATVLLVEAGNNENLLVDIPLIAMYLQLDKNINWDYFTEPSNNICLAMKNRQCRVPKGKIMGGSSTINFMIATRGTKHDYDEWAQLTGDSSWSYEEILKYFKKLENHNVTLVKTDPSYHSTNGPINIVDPPYVSPLAKAFVKAGEELGFPPVDYNGEKITGFNYMQTNQVNGERLSTNRAYLHPIKNRKNLHLSLNSHVNKVLIDPKTKTAYGVEFTKGNHKIEVRARKEVILSAGSIATPQILMLSGVGPAQHLHEFGINVIADLPVGENLIDHVAYGGLTFFVNQSVGITTLQYLNPTNPMITDYLTKRTGEFSLAGGAEALAFLNVDHIDPNNVDPNVELVFASISFLSDYFLHLPLGIDSSFYNKYFIDKLYNNAWTIWPVLLKPKSRGKLLLRNTNPKAYPRIFGNYFSDPDDMRVMIKAVRAAVQVSKTRAMQHYGSKLYDRPIPGCERHKPNSDTYWECALKTLGFTFWHHVGTCKMGRDDDSTAVVNSKLQVKGINQLRVVDASIMPTIPAAHLNIPTIAIAEKAADIIKLHYSQI